MKIPPNFSLTSEILAYISKIDSLRLYFTSINLPSHLKTKIQRTGYLKSSLFSARIEGNPLQLEEFESAEDIKKQEIFDILAAVKYLNNWSNGQLITKKIILNIHQKVTNSNVGLRKEMSAIYSQTGAVVCLPPPPTQVISLTDKLIEHINKQSEFPLITALIAHLVFEKIHPFLDGNGRTGRLLITTVLKSKNYDFGLTVPFEEYLDGHKSEYYHYLDVGLRQTEDYLLFMLEAIYQQTEKVKETVENEKLKENKIYLPPRQEEIYQIVKEHKIVTFDFIKRRFLKISPRTLHYDLKKLVDKKLVVKIGRTRGVYYRSCE